MQALLEILEQRRSELTRDFRVRTEATSDNEDDGRAQLRHVIDELLSELGAPASTATDPASVEQLLATCGFLENVLFDLADADSEAISSGDLRAAVSVLRERTAMALRHAAAAPIEVQPDALLTAMPAGLALLDLDLRYVRINDAFSALTGVPRDQLIGRTLGELRPEVEPIYRAVIANARAQLDREIASADAPTRHLSISVFPVKGPSGRVVMVGSLVTDLSNSRRTEDELRQRIEFEQQLIGIVSHDLRNPLSVVTLSASALLHREDLDGRTMKSVARIVSNAERARRLIGDLLDFTQVRLGDGIPIHRKPVDLGELARSTVEDVRASFAERTVRLDCHGETRGEWDPDRMAQVIMNLVSNALKYSAADSLVTVELRGDDDKVAMTVHNNGVAIPRELLPRLFEPLARGPNHNDGGSRSVGLGLYIVKHLVAAHDGRVDVSSTDSAGTRFTVTLPRFPTMKAAPKGETRH